MSKSCATNVHFSSKTDLWETPQDLFDKYNQIYSFDLDVCATPENAKCKKYFTQEQDGLMQEWKGSCWMNPPYGREISKWVKKAYESSLQGALIACLLPVRTDTKWWNDYCVSGEVEFMKKRLRFGNSKNFAPFPSAIVIFGSRASKVKLVQQNWQCSVCKELWSPNTTQCLNPVCDSR